MIWWTWAIIGLFLFAIEAAGLGGLFLVFFGVGAVAVSLLSYLGLAEHQGVQWLLFGVISFLSMFLFRSHIVKSDAHTPSGKDFDRDSMIGTIAIVNEDIPAGGEGSVSIRGAAWSAVNRDDIPLPSGTRCKVIDLDGLTVGIKKEG